MQKVGRELVGLAAVVSQLCSDIPLKWRRNAIRGPRGSSHAQKRDIRNWRGNLGEQVRQIGVAILERVTGKYVLSIVAHYD